MRRLLHKISRLLGQSVGPEWTAVVLFGAALALLATVLYLLWRVREAMP